MKKINHSKTERPWRNTARGLLFLASLLTFTPSPVRAQGTERILYDNGGDPFGETLNFWSAPSAPENWLGAQQFLTDDLGYVSSFTFILAKWNSGTSGEASWQIWDSIDGEPGEPLATIGTTETSTLPSSSTGGETITLSVPPIKLEPNSPYFLVIDLTNVPTPNANQTVAGGTVNNNASGTRGAAEYLIANTPLPGAPLEWLNVANFLGAESNHLVLKATVSHLIVTNLNDSGPGSLRQALADASPNTVITFDPSLDGGTITLAGEQLVIGKNLTIDATSLPSGLTIDGNRESRVFKTEPGNTVALHGLTLTGGYAHNGGGIHNERATLTISDCLVVGNRCVLSGGGIYNDSEDPGTAILNLVRTTLSQNSSGIQGGAIHSGGDPSSGFFDVSGRATLTVYSCHLEQNKTVGVFVEEVDYSWGGAISSAGGISAETRASVVVTSSTIAHNSFGQSGGGGGGISIRFTDLTLHTSTVMNNSAAHGRDHTDSIRRSCGGGIYAADSMLNLQASTIANNFAASGGGVYSRASLSSDSSLLADRCTFAENSVTTTRGCDWGFCSYGEGQGGGIYGTGTDLLLRACTISGNSAEDIFSGAPRPDFDRVDEHMGHGGGVFLTGSDSIPSTLTLTDSIIAGNSAPRGSDLFLGEYFSTNFHGTQLISGLSGSGLSEDPSILVAKPLLAPLGDYGGPTPTMPPLPGSSAIDVFDDPQDTTTDQRGFPIVGQRDLGAVEYQGDADFRKVFDVDNDGDGSSFGIESALGTDPFTPDQNHPNNLGAPVFNGEAQPILTFGLGEDAHPDTTWILERSTDLLTFEEIYSFDGTTDLAAEGLPIEINRTAERITITDQAPPAKGAFYRFRAILTE